MDLLKIKDLTACVQNLETNFHHLLQTSSLVQLMKTVQAFNLEGYRFHHVMMQGKTSGINPVAIISEYENGIQSEYFLFFYDQFDRNIRDILTTTIDWTKCNHFYSVPIYQLPYLLDIAGHNSARLKSDARCKTLVLKDKTRLQEINKADDGVVSKLNSDQVSIINANWDYKYDHSELKVRHNIEDEVGYGVAINGQLVSWAVVNNMGKIGYLYTVPEARCRGYANSVVNTLSRHLLEMGLTPVADVEVNNTASMNLFCNTLGFEQTLECGIVTFNPGSQ